MRGSLMSVANAEDSQDHLTVLFCIPNTPDWRQATVALLSNFTYGRAYDETTTNIKAAQEMGRRIFETMAMCDLETQLIGINASLQVIADNTPRLYTIQEILDLAGNPGGIDFEQIESFLNIMGVLPGIKINPLQLLLDAYYKRRVLLNMDAQTIQQTSIAGSLVKGLGIDGIEAGIGAADAVTDEILDIINAGSGILSTLLTGIALFKDDQNGSSIKVLNDIALSLQISCSGCGQPQDNCHCSPEVGGPVAEEAASSLQECCTPSGFLSFSEYDNYACQAANWIADKSIAAIKQLELLHNRFYYDYIGAKQTNKLGPTEVYKRMATAISEIFSDTWLFAIPNEDRAQIITILTDRYMDFQNEVALTVPETQTIDQVVEKYWTDPFSPVVDDLILTKDTDKQSYFDADGPLNLLATFVARMTDAATQAAGYQPGDVQTILNHAMKQGLANVMYYKNLVVDIYQGDYVCTGSKCNCPAVWVSDGLQTGANTYTSEASIPNPGRHDLVLFANWDSVENELCGPEAAMTIVSILGWSEWIGEDFQIVDTLSNLVYKDNGPWPPGTVGRHLWIRSSTPFTATITFVSEGC